MVEAAGIKKLIGVWMKRQLLNPQAPATLEYPLKGFLFLLDLLYFILLLRSGHS
jgi:hypothetical protein